MTKEKLFQKDNIELFNPEGVEFISTLLFNIGYNYDNIASKMARIDGLASIRLLMELGLIEVFSWGDLGHSEDLSKASIEDKMNRLKQIWYEGAGIPAFYSMPMFKYKSWYLKALNEIGFEQYNGLWVDFVDEKIGDFQSWIDKAKKRNFHIN